MPPVSVHRPLRVLSVAYPLLPVGPGAGGGAEQILHELDRLLVIAGHRSFVIAAAGSQIDGELIATPAATGEMTEAVRTAAGIAHRDCIERALRELSIDLIHFHGLDFPAYLPASSTPQVATLHLPLSWYAACETNCTPVCVSRSQAAATSFAVIPNGIDLSRYVPGSVRESFLVWLGRICPEKGVHHALQVAHRLDLPLVIAGPVHEFAAHETYFADYVAPLLDEKRVYVGPVAGVGKLQLLQSARCLLIPSLVAETSSVVAMEAAACGTPVVAFRSGALPEVVAHEKTGLLVDSEEQMAAAAMNCSGISPVACRRYAEQHFDSRQMLDAYLSLYGNLGRYPKFTRHSADRTSCPASPRSSNPFTG